MNAVMNYEYMYYNDNSTMANIMRLKNTQGNKNKDLGEEFMEVLTQGSITTVFQPIISLKDGNILGYEALSS